MSWYDWPEPLKNRHLAALEEIYQSRKDYVRSLWTLSVSKSFYFYSRTHGHEMTVSILQIIIFIAQQFLFQRQWQKVCDYARGKGISIMGDMPIYVGYHSADVWANKKSFSLVSIWKNLSFFYLYMLMKHGLVWGFSNYLSHRTKKVFRF